MTFSLGAVNINTFSAKSIASALAAATNLPASWFSITVTDTPVSTSFTLSMNSITLTATQISAIQAAVSADLAQAGVAGANVTVGTPAAGRRRLLDVSVPVQISGLGAAGGSAAAAVSSALTSTTLAQSVAAAGNAANASATPPVVTAIVSVVATTYDRGAGASSSASVASFLANASALSNALAAVGMQATVTVAIPPVTTQSPPGPPPLTMFVVTLSLSGYTKASFTGAAVTAFTSAVAATLSVFANAVNVTSVADASRRHLLSGVTVSFTVTTTMSQSAVITALTTGSTFSTALTTAFTAASLTVPTATGIVVATTTTGASASAAALPRAASGLLVVAASIMALLLV